MSIVGGGIAGLTLAAALDPERFEVTVYEAQLERAGFGGALTIWPDAQRALRRVAPGTLHLALGHALIRLAPSRPETSPMKNGRPTNNQLATFRWPCETSAVGVPSPRHDRRPSRSCLDLDSSQRFENGCRKRSGSSSRK